MSMYRPRGADKAQVIEFQAGDQIVNSLLNKGGVQEQMVYAGLDPIRVQAELEDYANYLRSNGAPEASIREDLASQLFATVRIKEVQNMLSSKALKNEIPF